jgi:DNA-binding GntR family transcriptional regulator
MGVSSSPIREALRRLEYECWIETIPFRGAFVRPFDEKELIELYEVRQIIEIGALEKLLSGPRPADFDSLQTNLERIIAALKSRDQRAYLEADVAFHRTLVEMAGNQRLSQMFATLVDQGKCFVLGRSQREMGRYEDGRDEHIDLLDAVRNSDRERAIRILHHHLQVTLEELRRSYSVIAAPDESNQPPESA